MEYSREVLISGRNDVVVCYGGPAGIAAAMCRQEDPAVQNLDSAKLVQAVRPEGSVV